MAPTYRSGPRMTIIEEGWGAVDGRAVSLYTLTNANGLTARITNYGGTVVGLLTPDRNGMLGDVVLGLDTLEAYTRSTLYFGATVGRMGNRIAGATFELDGESYSLAANHAPHHLHGGARGWDKSVWSAEPTETPSGPSLRLAHESIDGDEGYPGTVRAATTYSLTNDNELAIEMTATTDQTTIVNMVHHSYFNLDVDPTSDVRGHELQLFAGTWTPGMPPAGSVLTVAGSPFDFTVPKAIGRDLLAAGSPGAGAPAGYDSNWIVDGEPNALRPVARLRDPESGRVMTLRADQPGVQFYSGVFLDGASHGKGRTHGRYSGLCLETQAIPNAINVPAWRDQAILAPGQTYRHETIYGFATD
jgi:aldose 1-epimerase